MSETAADSEKPTPAILTKVAALALAPVRALARRDPERADALLRATDRARRAVGVGSPFPITHYDVLTEERVIARLDELSRPQLRKVRDYEKRNAKRPAVLDAIARALGS